MNKENAHLFLPLVQALADGKIIQRKLPHCKFRGTNLDGTTYLVDSPEEWVDGTVGGFAFHNAPEFYRIKPEPRTFEMWYYKPTGRIYIHGLKKKNNMSNPTNGNASPCRG